MTNFDGSKAEHRYADPVEAWYRYEQNLATLQTITALLVQLVSARITQELDIISAQTKSEGTNFGEENDQLRRKQGQTFLPRPVKGLC